MTAELQKLELAFATMPEAERAVFERARFAGLSYSEIAGDLGIDIETVERRMADAMLHLSCAMDSGAAPPD